MRRMLHIAAHDGSKLSSGDEAQTPSCECLLEGDEQLLERLGVALSGPAVTTEMLSPRYAQDVLAAWESTKLEIPDHPELGYHPAPLAEEEAPGNSVEALSEPSKALFDFVVQEIASLYRR